MNDIAFACNSSDCECLHSSEMYADMSQWKSLAMWKVESCSVPIEFGNDALHVHHIFCEQA